MLLEGEKYNGSNSSAGKSNIKYQYAKFKRRKAQTRLLAMKTLKILKMKWQALLKILTERIHHNIYEYLGIRKFCAVGLRIAFAFTVFFKLVLSDYLLFSYLKLFLAGKKFSSNEEMIVFLKRKKNVLYKRVSVGELL